MVLLIDERGAKLGTIQIQEALTMAEARGLDLVEVGPSSDPPVCRLMDYGKLVYEQKKKKRSAKARATSAVKEVSVRLNISEHDLSTKMGRVVEFLKRGHKVKVVIFFRGREMTYTSTRGAQMVERILSLVNNAGKLDQPVKLEGNRQYIVFSPV